MEGSRVYCGAAGPIYLLFTITATPGPGVIMILGRTNTQGLKMTEEKVWPLL